MRAAIAVALAFALSAGAAAQAQKESAPAYRGLWVATPFPSFDAPAGEVVTLELSVHNAGLAPQPVQLQLEGVPEGWSASFVGEGKRVRSVFVAPNDKATVRLRLEPSPKATRGSYRFAVVAVGAESRFRLPLELHVGRTLPPRLALRVDLPELRGSPGTEFDFKAAVRNEGGDDAVVRVDAAVPQGFRVRVTEQWGQQELPSFTLKAGEEKTVSVKIQPPFGAKEGRYPVLLAATSGKAEAQREIALEVAGEPRLELAGRDERLSAAAEAGRETAIEIVVANTGSATARDVKLDASTPSGWKVTFQPERIEAIEPNARQTVKALVVPAAKAIAGDYMMTVRASAGGANRSADFRVTVRTSTLWGVVGILVIAAALVVLVAAMLRFGRR
ncbi:MAG: NEW3 domain-containing protein [Burkholderiales bacterium]|nr:NEW3 domain-containing protein [Burkholderiales bacterium]